MSKYGIETFDDLYADRERLQGEKMCIRDSCKLVGIYLKILNEFYFLLSR